MPKTIQDPPTAARAAAPELDASGLPGLQPGAAPVFDDVLDAPLAGSGRGAPAATR